MIFNSYAEGRETLAGMQLVSCGHIFAKPQREIYRPAGRDDWLLFYIAKEQETFFTDRTVTAQAGSFILFAPGEKQHHIYLGERTAEFYYVHFRCDALPETIRLDTSHVYSPPPRKRFVEIFEEILEETLQKKPHYELLCISSLLQLLSLLGREAAEIISTDNRQWSSVVPAIQHINRNCNDNLCLGDYADLCCMSKYHFARVFKQVTGLPPLEYRARIRIEHAKELLSNSFLSVSEIASTLGYASPAYFSDSFKRQVGLSPRDFREGKDR